MGKRKSQGLVALALLASVFTVNTLCTTPASASSGRGIMGNRGESHLPTDIGGTAITYGLDHDGIPFALRSDGTKARFLRLSSRSVKLQILKNSDRLGEAEFQRLSKSQLLATFTDKQADVLSVRAKLLASGRDKSPSLSLAVQFGKLSVVIAGNDRRGDQNSSSKTQSALGTIIANVKGSNMKCLLDEIQFFATKSTIGSLAPLLDPTDSCGWAVTSCISSLIEYGLGMALIAEVCAETFGVGCLLALAWHPVTGVLVGRHCGDAFDACGATRPDSGDTGPGMLLGP